MSVFGIWGDTCSVNTMVHFENSDGDDTLTIAPEEIGIGERPVTAWWTISRYVTVLSVAGCLLTSLTVAITVSVYVTSHTGTLNDQVDQNAEKEQSEYRFVLASFLRYFISLH